MLLPKSAQLIKAVPNLLKLSICIIFCDIKPYCVCKMTEMKIQYSLPCPYWSYKNNPKFTAGRFWFGPISFLRNSLRNGTLGL